MTISEAAPTSPVVNELELRAQLPVPDVKSLLSEAILLTDAANDDPLRSAVQAESRGEMNEDLELVMDTIIGIKLLGIHTEDLRLVEGAETIFLAAVTGDEVAQQTANDALTLMKSRSPAETRMEKEKAGLSEEPWFTEDSFKDRYKGAEQLGYEHLSIVHATDHEPRRSSLDQALHIDDRFTADGHARSTVHVALNHMVESDARSSDWSGRRVVVVAPMDKVVELNGEPSTLIGHDTWWEALPNKGLVLPEGAVVIKPGASKPIQSLHDGKELRYKADGITSEDIIELLSMARDYELTQTAQLIGLDLHLSYNHSSPGNLRGTTLAQYGTELTLEQRQTIIDKMSELDSDSQTKAFTDLAKRTAVRIALEAQGREVIEPRTTMDSSFLSEQIDDEINKLAFEHGAASGHHSESVVGRLEQSVRAHTQNGVFEAGDETKERLTEQIRSHVDEIGKGTLHMYYRLGLL